MVGWERWDYYQRQPVPPADVACYSFFLPCLVQEEPGLPIPWSFPGAVNIVGGLLSSLSHPLPSWELPDWGSAGCSRTPGEQNEEHPAELRKYRVQDRGRVQLTCKPASVSRVLHFTVKGFARAVHGALCTMHQSNPVCPSATDKWCLHTCSC